MLTMYSEAVRILMDEDSDDREQASKIVEILEDANSPITRKHQENLYKSVLSKAHIDFDDIPQSRGNIKRYKGYNQMIEVLDTMQALCENENARDIVGFINTIRTAIKNLEFLADTYEKGFNTKTDYVAMEYDCYVYFCVEATTALIYSFVEILKDPEKQVYQMRIKNNKLRANEFYFDQLKRFNASQSNLGVDYKKFLEQLCLKGKDNFTGAEVIGASVLMSAALSVIPITRRVISQIYNFRGKLANNLEMQANFLEMNKTAVEANDALTMEKRKKVVAKQEKLASKMRKMADEMRVKSATSVKEAEKSLKNENKGMTLDSLKSDIENSPLELF